MASLGSYNFCCLQNSYFILACTGIWGRIWVTESTGSYPGCENVFIWGINTNGSLKTYVSSSWAWLTTNGTFKNFSVRNIHEAVSSPSISFLTTSILTEASKRQWRTCWQILESWPPAEHRRVTQIGWDTVASIIIIVWYLCHSLEENSSILLLYEILPELIPALWK